jgi:hypothetical protein
MNGASDFVETMGEIGRLLSLPCRAMMLRQGWGTRISVIGSAMQQHFFCDLKAGTDV